MSQNQTHNGSGQQSPLVANGQLQIVDRRPFGLIVRIDVTRQGVGMEFEFAFHDVCFRKVLIDRWVVWFMPLTRTEMKWSRRAASRSPISNSRRSQRYDAAAPLLPLLMLFDVPGNRLREALAHRNLHAVAEVSLGGRDVGP